MMTQNISWYPILNEVSIDMNDYEAWMEIDTARIICLPTQSYVSLIKEGYADFQV